MDAAKPKSTTPTPPKSAPPARKPAEKPSPKPARDEPKDQATLSPREKDSGGSSSLLAGMRENYNPAVRAHEKASQDPLRAAVIATEGQAEGDQHVHVGHALQGLAQGREDSQWARPYADNLARLAWYDQYGKEHGHEPQDAPADYLASWFDCFQGGDRGVPLVGAVRDQMSELGVPEPTDSRVPAGRFDWRQEYGPNGESLATRQKYGNDCGVTAAEAMLRATGHQVDHEALFDDAVGRGYHTGRQGGEWTGPDRMADYLRSFGLDANAQPKDWNVVNQNLADGKPVVLSTDAHYFVISGRDEQGRYHVGATGEVMRGGSAWMTAEQLDQYSGGRLVTLDGLEPKGEARQPAERVSAGTAPPSETAGANPYEDEFRRAARAAGVPEEWATNPSLLELVGHESSWDPAARNPGSTATGLFQFLDSTWASYLPEVPYGTPDPYWQAVGGFRYIQQRYGTPERAWDFWQSTAYKDPSLAPEDMRGASRQWVANDWAGY